MRVFLIVLGISIVGSVVLWNFGIAQRTGRHIRHSPPPSLWAVVLPSCN